MKVKFIFEQTACNLFRGLNLKYEFYRIVNWSFY